MTSQQILNQLPWYRVHTIAFFVTLFFALTLLFFIGLVLNKITSTDSPSGKRPFLVNAINTTSAIMVFSVPPILIVSIGLVSGLNSRGLSSRESALVRSAPVETLKTTTIPLVSANSAGFADTEVNGSMWSISGTANDTTSYRYIIKSGDSYQVKTLTDQFGKVNNSDVFIKEENGRTQDLLIVKKLQYKDRRIRHLVDKTDYASKWSTYTFVVGEHSISRTTRFK